MRRFYFGEDAAGLAPNGSVQFRGLHPLVGDLGDIDAREINSIPIGDGIVLRVGRYGPYVERETVGPDGEAGTERAPVPEDLAPDELTVEQAQELLAQPSGDRSLGTDPQTGLAVVAKAGRFGPYVTEVLPEDAPKSAKPRTASLFKDDVARHRDSRRRRAAAVAAARRRRRPGGRGRDHRPERPLRPVPEEGHRLPVADDRGRSCSPSVSTRRSRCSPSPSRAVAAVPPPRRCASWAPTRLRPADRGTEGRFGAYVTDGETNATLRKGDSVESLTVERAAELLADKRAKGPAPKKRASARTSRKR